jgi:hypothetical protein
VVGRRGQIYGSGYDTLEELCWAIIVLTWKYCSVKPDIPLADVSNSTLASLIDSELSDTVRRRTSPFWCLKNKGSTSEIFKALDLISLDLERTAGLNELVTRTQIDFLCLLYLRWPWRTLRAAPNLVFGNNMLDL